MVKLIDKILHRLLWQKLKRKIIAKGYCPEFTIPWFNWIYEAPVWQWRKRWWCIFHGGIPVGVPEAKNVLAMLEGKPLKDTSPEDTIVLGKVEHLKFMK